MITNPNAGIPRPTQLVESFKQNELAPVLAGTPGAQAGVKGMTGVGSTAAGLQPRSFKAVDSLVTSGHEASMARIQNKNKAQALASAEKAKQQTAKGIGGIPVNYGQPRTSYQKQVVTPYAQQGLQGGGFGGRAGTVPQASNAFNAMEQAYSKVFGGGIPITEGFRSYQGQVDAWNRYQRGGPMAAKPGTSMHGKGIALDLGGAFQNANSAQHKWLQRNGAQFGWYWIGKQYGEPWHWEYRA